MILRLLALAALAAGCLATSATGRSAAGASLRIAFTSEVRANLLPCLCPKAPLGGLARRVGYLDSLRAASEEPLLLLDGGSLLPDRSQYPGLADPEWDALESLHRGAAVESDYDAILLGPAQSPPEGLIGFVPNQAKRIERGGLDLILVGIDEGVEPSTLVEDVDRLGPADLTILLCAGDYHYASRIAPLVGADLAILGRGARYHKPVWREGVLFLGAGANGKYVGNALLEIDPSGTWSVASLSLRPMDGTAPSPPQWRERVEELVLEIEGKRPGILLAAE